MEGFLPAYREKPPSQDTNLIYILLHFNALPMPKGLAREFLTASYARTHLDVVASQRLSNAQAGPQPHVSKFPKVDTAEAAEYRTNHIG